MRLTSSACTALLLSFAMSSPASAETYYVSTTGDDDRDGLSERSAWRTISYASSQVAPGDTVYVEAGNYGNENVEFSIDGTQGQPIVFAGYHSTPGDRPDVGWSYPESVEPDPSIMPLLDGASRAAGTAITMFNRRHIELRNIQVRNYEQGINIYGAQFVTIDNAIVMSLGDTSASYSGKGFVLGSRAHDNVLSNSVVYNASAEGISVVGDSNTIENNRVYCDDNSNGHQSAMDYYLHVSGNDNRIIGNYVERVGELDHGGHGIGVKGDGTGNLFTGNEARHLSGGLYVRHRGAMNNTFYNNAVFGSIGILVRDGASNNTFTNTRIVDANYSISYMDTAEDEGAQWAGSDNLFVNTLVINSQRCVVGFNRYDRDSEAFNNLIVNATIVGAPLLFCGQRSNRDNTIRNSVIVGVDAFEDGDFSVDVAFENNAFFQNGFTTPDGSGNVEVDPMFADLEAGDYRLDPESPLIDRANESGAPNLDADGTMRPQGAGYDIGAYEYAEPSPDAGLPNTASDGGAPTGAGPAGSGVDSDPTSRDAGSTPTGAPDPGVDGSGPCRATGSTRPAAWLPLMFFAAAMCLRRRH